MYHSRIDLVIPLQSIFSLCQHQEMTMSRIKSTVGVLEGFFKVEN